MRLADTQNHQGSLKYRGHKQCIQSDSGPPITVSLVNSSNRADRAFAREALGKTRFELVKSGKLKIESLYYNGKLRSIKELKRLMK